MAGKRFLNGVIVSQVFTMTYVGTLVVGAGSIKFYAHKAMTVTNVIISVGTAPTGASIIVDVNKNGTTMFTTQGNRPTIAISGTADTSSVPDVTSMAVGDYFTVDIDQIGSTIAGANLVVEIVADVQA